MPLPRRQGLYDPAFEHDACGLGFVATLNGKATHQIVAQGLDKSGSIHENHVTTRREGKSSYLSPKRNDRGKIL